uniref:Uncharacterized protein n=1 Tax=Anopheles atroparvus TaxID=41427 RepID=A0A182IJJ8_ANOAO
MEDAKSIRPAFSMSYTYSQLCRPIIVPLLTSFRNTCSKPELPIFPLPREYSVNQTVFSSSWCVFGSAVTMPFFCRNSMAWRITLVARRASTKSFSSFFSSGVTYSLVIVSSSSDRAISSSSVAGPSPTALADAGVLLTLAPGVPGVVGTKLTPGLPPAPGCTVGGVRVHALATVEVGTGAGVGLPPRDVGRAGKASFDLGVVEVVVVVDAAPFDRVDPGFDVVVGSAATGKADFAVVNVGAEELFVVVVTVPGFTVVPALEVVDGATVVVDVLSFFPKSPPKKPVFFVVGVATVVVVVVVVVVVETLSSFFDPPPKSLPKKPFFVVVDGMGVVLGVGAATVDEGGVTLGSTGANITLGKLDESKLVILFADAGSWHVLVESMQQQFLNTGHNLWQARVLVLVEDQYFGQRATMVMLKKFFRHFNIGYWSVTAERRGTYVRYVLDFALEGVRIDGPMDFRTVYTYRRFIVNRQNVVQAQGFFSFPYSFIDLNGHFVGFDIYLYDKLFQYLNLRGQWQDINMTEHTPADIGHMIMDNLNAQNVDLTITRQWIETDRFPMVVVPEPMYICLVVPTSTRPALLGILWRPFTDALWISIAVVLAFVHGVKLLANTRCQLGRQINRIVSTQPMAHFISVTIGVITFVLIESYLAQITSFLLVHRFQRNPVTLEEFFATSIRVHVLEQQMLLLSVLDPTVAEAILARAEIVPVLDEFSTNYAHIDTMARASFVLAAYTEPTAASHGRKSLYILPEPLGSVPLAYLFAPVANPLRDYLALHLSWMNTFGFMVQADRLYNGLLQIVSSRATVGEDLIKLEHLEPFVIVLSIGWAAGVFVFFGEILMYAITKRYQRNR